MAQQLQDCCNTVTYLCRRAEVITAVLGKHLNYVKVYGVLEALSSLEGVFICVSEFH